MWKYVTLIFGFEPYVFWYEFCVKLDFEYAISQEIWKCMSLDNNYNW